MDVATAVEKQMWSNTAVINVWKDYAISWILYGLWRNGLWHALVLKGGTCLRKAYYQNYRLSIDLDYTTNVSFDVNQLYEGVVDALQITLDKSPVRFITENVSIKKRIGKRYHTGEFLGYQITIPFTPPRRWRSTKPVISMDITLEKYEKIFLATPTKSLFHPYNDGFSHILTKTKMRTYSLEEIFAEKIRSLYQRVRVRDLYDLWFLRNDVNMGVVRYILPKKFEMKDITYNISEIYDKKLKFRDGWNRYLRDFVREIPPFEDVWDSVMDTISMIFQEHER